MKTIMQTLLLLFWLPTIAVVFVRLFFLYRQMRRAGMSDEDIKKVFDETLTKVFQGEKSNGNPN